MGKEPVRRSSPGAARKDPSKLSKPRTPVDRRPSLLSGGLGSPLGCTPSQKDGVIQTDQDILLLYNAREGPIEAMELPTTVLQVSIL